MCGIGIMILVSLVLAIIAKKSRIIWITECILLFLCGLGGMAIQRQYTEMTDAGQKQEQVLSNENYLTLSYAMMSRESYEAAQDFLRDYLTEEGYDTNYLLAKARLCAMEGSYKEAEALYTQVLNDAKNLPDEEQVEDEQKEVIDCIDLADGKTASLFETIQDGIDQVEISQEVMKLAELYADVEKLVRKAQNEGEIDRDKAEKLAKKYADMAEKTPDLCALSTIVISRMQALTMAGDYETVAQITDRWDNTTQLLMFGELYRQGKISASDLKGNVYLEERAQLAQVCLEWISEQEEKSDFSKNDQEVIEAALAELEEATNNSKSAYRLWIKEQLLEAANKPNESESSKLYLLLSRLSYEDEGDAQAQLYLQKALALAGSSDDASYIGPVNRLNEIVENKEDTELLKEIDAYASYLVANMQVTQMKGLIEEDKAEQEDAAAAGKADKPSVQTADGQRTDDSGIIAAAKSSDDEFANEIAAQVSGDESFTQYVSDQVSQKTSAMNIVSIDASNFDDVSAIIALDESLADSEEKFLQNIRVIDTGVELRDVKVTKLPTTEVNIVLCCDKSGSMEGEKIEYLRTALSTFVSGLDAQVNVAIIPFSGGVESGAGLGSSAAQLKSVIDGLSASGGTNIYSAVVSSIGELPSFKDGALNMVILMSDGQDSMPNYSQLEELSAQCDEKGAMLYTMGLGGDVDSAVLSAYSGACGGQYSFVSSAASIEEFYKYIYQISNNRFRIEYTAVDTMTVNRKLQIEYIPDRGYCDEMSYSLYDVYGDELGEEYAVSLQNVTVNGLKERLVAHNSKDQTLHLIGTGLTNDKEIQVSIHAGVEYELTAEYENDQCWKLTLPAGAGVNVYDVYVTVDGKRVVFDDGLCIYDGTLSSVTFGGYVFTAPSIASYGDETLLSGYVQMNGWLSFHGDVVLRGNIEEDTQISMFCDDAYVRYSENGSDLNVITSMVAKYVGYVALPQFESIVLYKDHSVPAESGDYKAEAVPTQDLITLYNIINISHPGVRILPSKAEINFNEFTPDVPFQDTIIKKTKIADDIMMTIDSDETLVLGKDRIDIKFEIKVADSDNQEDYYPVGFGNMPIYLGSGSFYAKIDSEEGEVDFKIKADVAFLADGVGLEIALTDPSRSDSSKPAELRLDKIMLYCDYEVDTMIGNIPATIHDFKLGVEDISKVENLTYGELIKMKLTGGCSLSFVKLSAFMPKLEKYIKADWIEDVSVASLEEITVQFCLKDFYISVEAKAKILEMIEVGHAKLEMGCGISYTNALLNMNKESVNGIVGEITVGIKFEGSLCDIDGGLTGQLALTDKVMGYTGKGSLEAEFEWWVFVKRFNTGEASMFLGFYEQHNGDVVFAVKVRTPNKDELVNLMFGKGGAL